MRFDAHQHYWNIERLAYPILKPEIFGELYRNIEPSELKPLLDEAGVDGTVIVQVKDGYDETEYLLELADQYDWIAGVVGWVNLARSAESVKQLERFTMHPKFKGVRHLIMVNPDSDWLVREPIIQGLEVLADFGIAFDVGAEFPKHLKHVSTLAERVPTLRIVIDHLAKPPFGDTSMVLWEQEMRRAASYPQVFAKVSGLNPSVDIQSAIDVAFEAFGADRLMFGSDWPVTDFKGNYNRVWQVINEAVSGRSAAERDALFGGTAKAFYRL